MRTVTPVTDVLARVAGAARDDVGTLCATVLAGIDDGLPELGRDPRVREMVVGTVQASLEAALGVLTGHADPEAVPVPPAGTELARRLAQQGVPVTTLLRAYRLGQAVFQQALITRIAAEDLDAGQVADAARELSSVAFGFVDRVSEELVAVHQAERDGWVRRRNSARLATVTAVLAGRGGTAAEVERGLGHGVGGTHVAAVFWCPAEAADPGRALERAAGTVGDVLDCPRPPLLVAPDAATLWAWYPAPARTPDEAAAALHPGPSGGPGSDDPGDRTPVGGGQDVLVALGTPEQDLAGFRRSHGRARQAQAVAVAAAPGARRPVTTADALGPLVLLGTDPDLLAGWVADVLGDLATDDEQHERLRHTLDAYLGSGGSLAAAASALHLHKNSVQYRLRRAEEVRGRPLVEGRLDVEVALLACRLLGATVLRAPG